MINVSNIEEVLTKIPGIQAAKAVVEDEEIVELHVVADDEKLPKQIVRDIETVLFASLGIKIDRKVISIAQLNSKIETSKVLPYRLEKLDVKDEGKNIKVSVEIVHGQEKMSGEFSGPKTSRNIPIVIGNAVLNALENIHDFVISVDDIAEVSLAGKNFLITHLTKEYKNVEESIIGAAPIEKDKYTAIAESVLEAFRRL
ncbi:hypothetical protein [Thermosipho globiformans]|uniref:hypothetical protein n=1 Tax=Thermosipho globiformans TaxID=380685 RepID=UPI000F8ECDDD|nr:hypothetical protein [Thermosipho globiformans]